MLSVWLEQKSKNGHSMLRSLVTIDNNGKLWLEVGSVEGEGGRVSDHHTWIGLVSKIDLLIITEHLLHPWYGSRLLGGISG